MSSGPSKLSLLSARLAALNTGPTGSSASLSRSVTPNATSEVPTPPAPAIVAAAPPVLPKLLPPPLPPSVGTSMHSGASLQDGEGQTHQLVREITEAVRIRNELYQLEDQLRGVRSWASSLERRGATESVRDVISVRVTDLEVRWREKHGKYKALVSGLKQDNLWPQPVDRDQQRARLADVAERASKLHDMLARLNLAEPRSAGRMDVGGARHKTGSKRRFSAVSSDPEHLPPAASASQGKERTTVGPSLEGITHQLNGAEANHTRESESVKVRTNKVAEDLRQLALERDAAVDSYAQLLQRVAAAEEQLRELGEALPELKAGRDAAIGQLDAARAEHELLRKMVRELESPTPTTASLVAQAQNELGALRETFGTHLQAVPRSLMTPRQLFELVQEHLRDEVSSVVQTLLEGHKSERDRLLAEHNKKWAQDIVRRVQGALNAVEALANRPEGDVTAPVGPATH